MYIWDGRKHYLFRIGIMQRSFLRYLYINSLKEKQKVLHRCGGGTPLLHPSVENVNGQGKGVTNQKGEMGVGQKRVREGVEFLLKIRRFRFSNESLIYILWSH